MIEVTGIAGSEEHAVALAISEGLAKLWPGVTDSPAEDELVKIASNAKLSGYGVSDIDIVVAARFKRPRYFVPKKPLKGDDGRPVVGVKVRVPNFVAAIEVKGHSSDGVRVAGDEVSVKYGSTWKSATDQNVKQAHALKDYLGDQHADCFVHRCVVLAGLQSLPRAGGSAVPAAGAVCHGFSGGDLLTALAGVFATKAWNGEYSFSSANDERMKKVLAASLFREIVPSNLDRKKMDWISSRREEAVRLSELLGEKRIHVRGHGGTGKTILALQAAHEAYLRHGKRTLVLTYNLALAADIQRLLALLGVPSGADGGGIEVRTAMSFIHGWLLKLGVAKAGPEPAYSEYAARCAEALELLAGGAVSQADVLAAMDGSPDELMFDAVIVDEAQDWPQDEASLLVSLYGPARVSVADGGEQLVRGVRTDWRRTLPKGALVEDRHLARCLRMKRNLGVFANTVAERAGLNWSVEPNDEAAGGKVILLQGSYGSNEALQEALVASAEAAGNRKIDFLHCVPPANVVAGAAPRSQLGSHLVRAGHEIWDGVDPSVRAGFPRSVDQFRIVQYDSCRGLEGWVTVLEDFDTFWEYKRRQGLGRAAKLAGPTPPADFAQAFAWRWAMIALTRPMDTLVISCTNPGSNVSKLLSSVARAHPDFVEVVG